MYIVCLYIGMGGFAERTGTFMFNLQSMIASLLQRNPNVANNPQAQQMLNVLQSGDEAQGQQIAENILKSHGLSKEEGVQQARQFFGM